MGTTEAVESKPHQYDVFINHRGRDVKKTFAAHLYDNLKKGGFRPFLDSGDIREGSHLVNSINEALEGARVHVAIFSKGYAESKHCLNELCYMLESGKEIIPVFYHVDPADLHRIEDGPFDDGFRNHIERGRGEQIKKWKKALLEISNYRGLRLDEVNWNEAQMIYKIVDVLRVAMVRHQIQGVQPPPVSPYPTTISETQPNGSTTRLPTDVPPEQGAHPHGEGATRPPTLGRQAQETGDRRLNILVLGDPESVEAVITHVCGARSQHTPVQDHPNLRVYMNSQPPIRLYCDTTASYKKNFRDLKTFVKARNKKWHRTNVEVLWASEVDHNNPKKWTALSPELRLHMLWFVCKKTSDLPDTFKWSEITKSLCDLPAQVLVLHDSRTDLGTDLKRILKRGSNLFPKAEMLKELIVEVALDDEDLKENLWRVCWVAKTRAEIWNAAKIIREIRKQLGSEGKSFPVGVGSGGIIKKEVSLRRSGEFVFQFLCTYWNIPQDRIRQVLVETTTFWRPLAKQNNIKPYEFVKFCLTVAAIILYDTRDSAGEPKYVLSNQGITSESNFDQFLQTEPYFERSHRLLYYDNMRFEDIRRFLQSISERRTPCRV